MRKSPGIVAVHALKKAPPLCAQDFVAVLADEDKKYPQLKTYQGPKLLGKNTRSGEPKRALLAPRCAVEAHRVRTPAGKRLEAGEAFCNAHDRDTMTRMSVCNM